MKKAPPFKSMLLPSGALLDFSRPLVMSIVNCTPDSFYPQSRTPSVKAAAERALKARDEGADIVDFGAESTRPGSDYIDEEEELRRLIPALKLFRKESALPVSVDTRRARTARAALDEGADIVNDISALSDPAMVPLCAERKAALVVMHMRGTPKTMQALAGKAVQAAAGRPIRGGTRIGLAEEIHDFLHEAAERAAGGGVDREKIILDPGIGFGKTTKENLFILNRLATISGGDYPLLVGLSRKNFIGEITGRGPEGRLAGTLAALSFAILAGADIVRVHDTAETADAAAMIYALRNHGEGE